jgi:hypothetical protein
METTEPGQDKLTEVLKEYAAARLSGVLRVDGRPGGIIYLIDGGISACETSGAPSLEVILLRSRRIAESDWDAAFTAMALNGRPMTAELVERGLLGAGEVEALLRTALADAVFALVSGQVDGWEEAPPADCLLPLRPAARAGWLLAEATRRRQVLASFPGPVVSAADRAAAAPAARAGLALGQGQAEILALADGRRTARDLAFALGRGLYETMLQLARMRAANVVTISSHGKESSPPGRSSGAAFDAVDADLTATGLPRRRKERPGSSRTGEASRRNLTALRMLWPRSEGNTMPEGT